jgi:SAM-dependent methyltransferase
VSGPGFRDHFSAAAAGYAAFRPTYPAALFEFVTALAPARSLAWDAGTGSGQAACALAERFNRVIATDPSRAQIAHAVSHPRVRYVLARAEDGFAEDGACDLVTAAQALHWFDIPAFFAAARRALKPGGAIAVWGYAGAVLDDPACDAVFQAYAREAAPYWPPERAIIDDGYRGVAFPFDEVAAPRMELVMHPGLAEFTGYLRTWSASLRYREAVGHDPVDELEGRLREVWPAGARVRLTWPLHLRAGRSAAVAP